MWKYKVFVIDRDFVVYDQVSCDPYTESCFASICEEGDEECDDTPYKKIEKSARFISACNVANGDECPDLSCGPTEVECVITTCSEDTLDDNETCVFLERLPDVSTGGADESLDGVATNTPGVLSQ